jgi:hypothetical protein
METINLTVLISVVSSKRDKQLQKYDFMFHLNVKAVKNITFMFLIYSKMSLILSHHIHIFICASHIRTYKY